VDLREALQAERRATPKGTVWQDAEQRTTRQQ